MSIYYEDDLITLHLGNSFEVMAGMSDSSVDCVITDPPYTERVHKNATSNRGGAGAVTHIDFAHFTDELLMSAFNECGRITRRWVISTLDYAHAFSFEQNPPNQLEQKRIGVWVKTNPMPQISADRPAQGWEAISYLHKKGEKPFWNGGGRHGNYVSSLPSPTGHPTPKPVQMLSSFVERFTEPSDLILDPFAGGGRR